MAVSSQIAWQIVLRDLYPEVTREVIQAGPNSPLKSAKWSWVRTGGCEKFEFMLNRAFDDLGGIAFFRDVELKIEGVTWWRGYIQEIEPDVETKEEIKVTARGYSWDLETAELSWHFPRITLRDISGIGEIAGVIMFLLDIFPNVAGRPSVTWDSTSKTYTVPHPVFDSFDIDQAAYRPKELSFNREAVRRIILKLAVLAGNFEWGVDQNRLFYFKNPQQWTTGTAQYTTDETYGEFRPDTSTSNPIYYGDETYRDPTPVGALIPPTAHVILGKDITSWKDQVSVASLKNIADVFISPPPGPFGDVPSPRAPVVTVFNPNSISTYGRRQRTRLSAPGFVHVDDGREWGRRRLELLGLGSINSRIITSSIEAPLEARGSLMVIPDASTTAMGIGLQVGVPRIERILQVTQSFKGDNIETRIELGIPASSDAATLGQEMRDQSILLHDRSSEETSPFIQVIAEPVDTITSPAPTMEVAS